MGIIVHFKSYFHVDFACFGTFSLLDIFTIWFLVVRKFSYSILWCDACVLISHVLWHNEWLINCNSGNLIPFTEENHAIMKITNKSFRVSPNLNQNYKIFCVHALMIQLRRAWNSSEFTHCIAWLKLWLVFCRFLDGYSSCLYAVCVYCVYIHLCTKVWSVTLHIFH